jgi:uncharacterized protein YaaR (DUF327 family)
MAKIDFPDGNTPFFNPAAYTNVKPEAKKTKDKIQSRGVKETKFSGILETYIQETETLENVPFSEEALQKLLDGVHSTGDDLKNRPFPEEIKRYKGAVKKFLHYVVENSYAVEEQIGGINILKRTKYTLLQVVDQKLERLAAGILAGQTAQLELLARIDEISGILVNLLQ